MKQLFLSANDLQFLNELQRQSFESISKRWWLFVKEMLIVSFLVGGVVPNFVILGIIAKWDTNMPMPLPLVIYGSMWAGISGGIFSGAILLYLIVQKRKISSNLINNDENFVTFD